MISFNDVKLTEQKNMFFIPEPLKGEVILAMKAANIELESINWRRLDQEKYKSDIQDARQRFNQVGYTSTTCIGVLISKVDNNQLFEKCRLFFGNTMDPDYKAKIEEQQRIAHQVYEECYKDWLKPGQIPVAADE